MAQPWPYLDFPVPFGFAHRGGNDTAAENSMAAFQRAVDLGYRFIETDVHATADGVLIAFHDDRLDRVTDREGVIAELTWAEISEARIGGIEPIPLFEEVLTRWPQMRINVDPKADDAVEPLVEMIRRHGAIDRVCVGSFVDERIQQCRTALGPELCTSPGPRGFVRVLLRTFYLPVPIPPVGCVQVSKSYRGIRVVTPRFVRRVHGLGLQVHVWTINDAKDMHALLDLGVDAIMTDEVALLKQVLHDRGEWPASISG